MSLFLKKLLGIGFQIYTFSKLFSNVKFCDHTKLLSTINTVHGLSPKACLKPSSKNMESERNRGGSMLLGLNLQPLQTIQRHYIYRKEQNMFLVSRSCTTAQWLMFRMTAKHNILHRLLKIVTKNKGGNTLKKKKYFLYALWLLCQTYCSHVPIYWHIFLLMLAFLESGMLTFIENPPEEHAKYKNCRWFCSVFLTTLTIHVDG